MAGEWLVKEMMARGGHDSDYSDVVFGTVVSTSPLQVQISNTMTLTSAFLTTGQAVSTHSVPMVIDGERKTVKIENGLKSGDRVAMIRGDGGQTFYIFDRV
ncbi:DUF2577 domain-containing protein [Lactiplantibacillus sp. WILCCON 0030]|uniref:DUF2577 domain-containing protein n=1 Tax=Lactiplantibacillus brownii TaxID=3069269 RepID=A0ABU1A844_9LACO|nr:DUF2577 domain-containing protein [Lactiplantibacillus brownii]MDQ7937109.1 DUF2577 domain-containing protein [Lactiplantibacillus brownii]